VRVRASFKTRRLPRAFPGVYHFREKAEDDDEVDLSSQLFGAALRLT